MNGGGKRGSRLFRMLAGEFIGTFCLVFAGAGAVVVNQVVPGSVGNLGISLVFGLVVTAIAYGLGEVSGAHINPAVTLGLWAAGQFRARLVFGYIIAQCLGAVVAAFALQLMFGTGTTLGATIPHGSQLQSCILEVFLTAFLMYVILAISTLSKEQQALGGIVVGGVIALEALFGGPISGASMNPARSLGPAVVSGNLKDLLVYVVGPIVGAMLAVFIHWILSREPSER